MKRIAITTALAVLAISAGTDFTPAQAQVMITPSPYAYTSAPVATSYYAPAYVPAGGYTTVQTYRTRGILPGFPGRRVVATQYVGAPVVAAPVVGARVVDRAVYPTTYVAPGPYMVRRNRAVVYPAPVYAAPAPFYPY